MSRGARGHAPCCDDLTPHGGRRRLGERKLLAVLDRSRERIFRTATGPGMCIAPLIYPAGDSGEKNEELTGVVGQDGSFGRISDASGAVVPGAEIKVIGRGYEISVVSPNNPDPGGLYLLEVPIGGVLSILCEAPGYEPYRSGPLDLALTGEDQFINRNINLVRRDQAYTRAATAPGSRACAPA